MKKKFQISDPIWWGYNLEIELDDFFNLNDIIDFVLENLQATLTSLNLLPQAEMLQKVKKEFHIHGLEFKDIIEKNDNDTIYICRHEDTNNDTIKLH